MARVVKEQASAHRRSAVIIPRGISKFADEALGTGLSGGLDDLRSLLQPKRFYESLV